MIKHPHSTCNQNDLVLPLPADGGNATPVAIKRKQKKRTENWSSFSSHSWKKWSLLATKRTKYRVARKGIQELLWIETLCLCSR